MEQQISSWKEKYAEVKSTLMQMGKVESAATAFNTNVDAVLKIKGRRLAELAKELGMSWEELTANLSLTATKMSLKVLFAVLPTVLRKSG